MFRARAHVDLERDGEIPFELLEPSAFGVRATSLPDAFGPVLLLHRAKSRFDRLPSGDELVIGGKARRHAAQGIGRARSPSRGSDAFVVRAPCGISISCPQGERSLTSLDDLEKKIRERKVRVDERLELLEVLGEPYADEKLRERQETLLAAVRAAAAKLTGTAG